MWAQPPKCPRPYTNYAMQFQHQPYKKYVQLINNAFVKKKKKLINNAGNSIFLMKIQAVVG